MTGGEWVTLFHALMRVPAAVAPIAFEVGEDGAENEDEGKPVVRLTERRSGCQHAYR